MNHNPYHIILLKKLITLEAQLHLKKMKTTQGDIWGIIAMNVDEAKTIKKGAEGFANYVMQYVWDKKIFDFTEATLNGLCSVLQLTRRINSWIDFQKTYSNAFAEYCEINFQKPYSKLKFEEKMAIDGYVNSTVAIYTNGGLSNNNEFLQMPDFEKAAAIVKDNPEKRTRFFEALAIFLQESNTIFKACSIITVLITFNLTRTSYAKIVLIIGLAFCCYDILTDILRTLFTVKSGSSNWQRIQHFLKVFLAIVKRKVKIFNSKTRIEKRHAKYRYMDFTVQIGINFYGFSETRLYYEGHCHPNEQEILLKIVEIHRYKIPHNLKIPDNITFERIDIGSRFRIFKIKGTGRSKDSKKQTPSKPYLFADQKIRIYIIDKV